MNWWRPEDVCKRTANVLKSLENGKGSEETSTDSIVRGNPFSVAQAVELKTKLGLSVSGYKILKAACKEQGFDIFPSYFNWKKSKGDFMPDRESLTITEDVTECNLQGLLDQTTMSLSKIEGVDLSSHTDLKLIPKWGCDESSGYNMQKRRMGEMAGGDSSVFMMSLVPLQLESSDGRVVWENPTPNSRIYCRPIKLMYKKESIQLVKDEVEQMETQIRNLTPTSVGET